MTRAAAFLRAINVGGHTVRMEELRRIFTVLGLSRVETFIASGNVVFDTTSRNLRTLERTIARTLKDELGYDVATFIRTMDELSRIAAYEPFGGNAIGRASTFGVAFTAAELAPAAVTRLMALATDVDRFHVHGAHVYWLSMLKQSESTFSNLVFERTVGQPATFRGMNTIRRMAARYSDAVKGAS